MSLGPLELNLAERAVIALEQISTVLEQRIPVPSRATGVGGGRTCPDCKRTYYCGDDALHDRVCRAKNSAESVSSLPSSAHAGELIPPLVECDYAASVVANVASQISDSANQDIVMRLARWFKSGCPRSAADSI